MFPDIFQFTDTHAYLKAIYFHEMEKNPKITLLQFAKAFGFKTHTTMHHFLNGKRVVTDELIDKIAERYELDKGRRFYFISLSQLEKTPNLINDPKFSQDLLNCRPLKFANDSEQVNDLEFISNGLLQICLELLNLKSFSIENATALLDEQFTRNEIATAYKKLEYLGYVKDMKPTAKHFIYNQKDQPDIRAASLLGGVWFKQLLLPRMNIPNAADSTNWLTGFVLPVNEELMDDIRKFISSKTEEFSKKFEAPKGTSDNLSYLSFCLERISTIKKPL